MKNIDEIIAEAEKTACRYWYAGQYYKYWGDLQAAYMAQTGRVPMRATRIKVQKKVKLLMYF